jgi:hypothetical protein
MDANIIVEYLTDNWPGGIWLIIGGALAWFILKIKSDIKHVDREVTDVHSKLNQLPCEAHQTKMTEETESRHELHARMNSDISEVKTAIQFIKGSLEVIQQSLHNSNPYTQTCSPVSINREGYDMVERTGMNRMIDENWTNIGYYMEEKLSSENPYDIQQFLMEHVIVYPGRFIKGEHLDRLKHIAYCEGVSINMYLTVAAILIRDRYFLEKNIDIEEIDKNDPAKVIKGELE